MEASQGLLCSAGTCLLLRAAGVLRPPAGRRVSRAELLRAGSGLLPAAGPDHQHSAALAPALSYLQRSGWPERHSCCEQHTSSSLRHWQWQRLPVEIGQSIRRSPAAPSGPAAALSWEQRWATQSLAPSWGAWVGRLSGQPPLPATRPSTNTEQQPPSVPRGPFHVTLTFPSTRTGLNNRPRARVEMTQ